MTTIKTYNDKTIIAIKVPEDAYDFEWKCLDYWRNWKLVYFLKNEPRVYNRSLYYFDSKIPFIDKKKLPKILGKLSELSEEECERFVFKYSANANTYDKNGFKNYLYTSSVWSFNKFKSTAKDSLISLLEANGVNTSNPNTLLLIEKA